MSSLTDMDFLKSLCNRFVPCIVEFDSDKKKFTKHPAISLWTSVSSKESKTLAAKRQFRDWRHFMFLTGKETGLFAVDLDHKQDNRADHENKIDGIEIYEDWCGPYHFLSNFYLVDNWKSAIWQKSYILQKIRVWVYLGII